MAKHEGGKLKLINTKFIPKSFSPGRETTLSYSIWLISGFFLSTAFHLLWKRFYLGNSFPQAQIFPFVKAYANPNLFKSDPMVHTRHEYLSIYPRYLAQMLRGINDLQLVVYLDHLFWLLLSFFFAFKIALLIFKKRRSAFLSSFFLFFQYPMFFGYQGHFRSLLDPSHNLVGFTFGLMAIYLFLSRRKMSAFAILGIGAYFHSLSITHLFLLIFLSELIDLLRNSNPIHLFNVWSRFKYYLIYPIVTLPLFFFELKNKRDYSVDDIKTFYAVNSFESFPLSWPINNSLNFLAFIMFIFYCASRLNKQIPSDFRRWTTNLIFASIILCLLAIIGVEFFSSPLAIVFQGTRSTIWICWLGSLYLSSFLYFSFKARPLFLLGLISTIIAIAYPGRDFYLTNPLLPLGILLFELDNDLSFWKWSIQKIALGSAQIIFIILWIFELSQGQLLYGFGVRASNLQPAQFIGSIIVLSVWLILFLNKLRCKCPSPRIRLIFLFTVLIFSLGSVISIFTNQKDLLLPYENSWREVQQWANKNSNGDDIFITPPWLFGFRVFSERMPLVEWIDGTQQYFSPSYGELYRRRIRSLGFSLTKPLRLQNEEILNYNHLPLLVLEELKTEYDAKYYVVEKVSLMDKNSFWPYDTYNFRVVFENDYFRVVALF